MTFASDIVKLELAAAKAERAKIVRSIRLLAQEGRDRAKSDRERESTKLLDHIADAIEREQI